MASLISINQGADADIEFDVLNPDGSAADLTGMTGATAFFLNSDNSYLAASASFIGSSDCGRLHAPLTQVQIDALQTGDSLNTELRYDQNGKRVAIQFQGVLQVNASPFQVF